jgi:hypothetical protein
LLVQVENHTFDIVEEYMTLVFLQKKYDFVRQCADNFSLFKTFL